MRCLKVPGADPTIPYSFLPSFHLDGVMVCDYDFVPEVNHMRFVERLELCAAQVLEFLPKCGVVPAWNGFRQNQPLRNEVGSTPRDFGLLSGVG